VKIGKPLDLRGDLFADLARIVEEAVRKL
jgi:hypothetical protein